MSAGSRSQIIKLKLEDMNESNFETRLLELLTSIDEKLNIITSSPAFSGSVCDECEDGSGWYGDEDITMNCSLCNPEAY